MSNLAVVLQSDMSRASVELHHLRTNLTELQLKFSNSMEQSANTVEHLYNGVCIFIRKHTLENPKGAIKNVCLWVGVLTQAHVACSNK